MDLNGNLGNTGIPTKIAIPLGAVVAFGGYHFIQQWRAGKAATTSAKLANSGGGGSTGSLAATDSPYGPMLGSGDLNVQLPNTNAGQDAATQAGQYSALSTADVGITRQNQAIMAALVKLQQEEVGTSKTVASLLAVNPGALQIYKKLPPDSSFSSPVPISNIFPGR